MLKKSDWNNIIVGIMIMSISVMPSFSMLVGLRESEAAVNSNNPAYSYEEYGNIYDDPNGGYYQQQGSQYSLNANNILNSDIDITAKVLGCSKLPRLIIRSLANVFDKARIKKLTDKATDNIAAAAADQVTLDETSKRLLERTAKVAEDNKQREECLNGIVYYLAKQQLADITQKTVNWVNSGYKGEAFFVKNQESFFGSIKEQKLKELLGPFSDPEYAKNYPWGRNFARSMIFSARNKAEDALQSTLTIPAEKFDKSFTNGGWDEWLNMTQGIGNNPLSFNLNASNYINNKIDEVINNKKTELEQNNGFLSQKKCVEYNPDKEITIPAITHLMNGVEVIISPEETDIIKGSCKKYETVTPGQVILNKLNWDLSSPTRQLELANDINSSLNQVFSAMVSDLTKRGLSGLDKLYKNKTSDSNYVYDNYFGGYGINKVFDSKGNDISDNFYDDTGKIISINKGNGWETGGFDITKDLGDQCVGRILKKGVISTQKDYILAVRASQEKLPEITTALGDLDYCIPGPNPRWERSVQNVVTGLAGYIRDTYIDDAGNVVRPDIKNYFSINNNNRPWEQLNLPDSFIVRKGGSSQSYMGTAIAVGATIGTVIPGVGTLVGAAVGFIIGGSIDLINFFKNKHAAEDLDNARSLLETNKQLRLKNLSNTFETYKILINNTFGENSPMLSDDYYGYTDTYNLNDNMYYLPMANAGLALTKNIGIYALNVYDSNNEYNKLVQEVDGNIYRLTQIKNKVDAIINAAKKRRKDDYTARGDFITWEKCFGARFKPTTAQNCNINLSTKDLNDINNKNNIGEVSQTNTGSGITGGKTSPPGTNLGGNNFNNNPSETCVITKFNSNQTVIQKGKSAILSWTTNGCNLVSVSGIGSNQELAESATVSPKITTKYTIQASNNTNSDSKSLIIKVVGSGQSQ